MRRHPMLITAAIAPIFLLLTACSTPINTLFDPIPTLYEIPTLTPSPDLSVPALPASWTPQPILSPTPSVTITPSPTPTTTATPTDTTTPVPTPTRTNTPGPSPTPPFPPSRPLSSIRLDIEAVAAGFDDPTGMADAGDIPGRLYVTEKTGRIRIVEGGGAVIRPFLNISHVLSDADSEDGLLGLAFHPNYATNGTFFIYYSNHKNETVLARYQASGDPDRADLNSETVLLKIDQPTPEHNGGGLTFGPDGNLYLSLGDGGGIHGEYYNSQSGATLHGTIIRIDVSGGSPYRIPRTNPFIGNPAFRDEIWAYGLRNPWSLSFDRATSDVYIADVGEAGFEEINFQAAGVSGRNYGWPDMEGGHCYHGPRCEKPGMTNPAHDYPRSEGCAVIGGYVYRGRRYPALTGTYLFGDFCTGAIFGMQRVGGAWQVRELLNTGFRISAFGEDRAGELYVFDFDGGLMHMISAR